MQEISPKVSASFEETEDVCNLIIEALAGKQIKVGYGMLGSCLAVARLMNPGEDVSVEKEIKFVQDMMDWANMYWETSGGIAN
jgi:hypothetical protein